jgi:hypothetical protein
VVLKQTIAIQRKQIERMEVELSASRFKKLKDKLAEHKGNLLAMVSEYRIQKTRAERLDKQIRMFRGIFRLLPPVPGESVCRVNLDDKRLFAYFKEYGNPEMVQIKEEPTP